MTALRHIKSFKLLAGIMPCLFALIVSSVSATANSSLRTIPFERIEYGQYTVEVTINGSEPLKFMVDTAASRTSIFNKTSLRLGLEEDVGKKFVKGITAAGYRPTTTVKSFSFAGQTFFNHYMIILKDWDAGINEGLDGIIGMDVLDNLVLAFSHKTSTVKVRKGSRSTRSKYSRWKRVRLEDNPYPGQKFGLMFTYTQLGDLHIPTLLDTGASFTAINWMSVRGTSMAKERRRLREEWIVQGAIDSFKPRMRIRLNELHIGGIKLKQHEFLIMNFGKFPINNYGKYPLVIAGIDFFGGRDFVLDFVNDNLYIAPKPKLYKIGYRPSRIKRHHED